MTFWKSLAAAFLFASSANAATIDLWDTGADMGPSGDLHYSVSKVGTSDSFTTAAYKHPAWATPTVGDGQWITAVNSLGTQVNSAGIFLFSQSFYLDSGADSASITGFLSSDNTSEIFLNGVSTGLGAADEYHSFTDFSINSGFQNGWNTLTFQVTNAPGTGTNPIGLAVVGLEGEYTVPAVPLPAGLPLMLGGFGAFAFVRRRKS